MEPILYMAPLRGFTDVVFRDAFQRHYGGFDLAVAPFISTMKERSIKSSDIRKVLPEKPGGFPVIPQILGNDPDDFIYLAEHLLDLGYPEINWNLGCPFAMVAKKKRGSGLLPYPERIDGMLEKILSSVPVKLSVKTRLGRHGNDEILELMPIFNRYPLTEQIIHPRNGEQMYEGSTDLDMFERCLALSRHRVVYNGDINSLEDYGNLKERFPGVDRWMIGRGAIMNPLLPMMIKEGHDRFENRNEIFLNFHETLFEEYSGILEGPSHTISRLKGFWRYFSMALEDGKKIFKRIKKTKCVDRYREIVGEFLEQDPRWVR